MAKAKRLVKIYLDPVANTLNIWWDDPNKAHVSEEVKAKNRNDVIIKDKAAKPIGFETIGLFPQELNIAYRIKDIINLKKDEPFLLGPQ